MAKFDDEKRQLQADLELLQKTLESKSRRLDKLSKIQDLPEPAPGSVIRFSRPLGGSTRKYTFVALRIDDKVESWHLTGKANALRLLGLSESGNSWENLLIAIGENRVRVATDWAAPGEEPQPFDYFKGGDGKLYRVSKDDLEATQFWSNLARGWVTSGTNKAAWIRRNPGSFRPCDEDGRPLDSNPFA